MIKNFLDKPGLDTYDKGVKSRLGLKATKTELDEERRRVDGELSVTPIAERVVDEDTFPEFKQWTVEGIGKELFVKLWDRACKPNLATLGVVEFGGYYPEEAPDPEHPFLLNKLWLTYEEAIDIYHFGWFEPDKSDFLPDQCRTNLLLWSYENRYSTRGAESFNGARTYTCYAWVGIKAEIIRVSPDNQALFIASRIGSNGMPNLREILGIIDYQFVQSTEVLNFDNCNRLQNAKLRKVHSPVSFTGCKNITYETLEYLVMNRFSTNTFTVSVHADVYAKLTGDTSNASAAALSPEELAKWTTLAATAVSKNISFAI